VAHRRRLRLLTASPRSEELCAIARFLPFLLHTACPFCGSALLLLSSQCWCPKAFGSISRTILSREMQHHHAGKPINTPVPSGYSRFTERTSDLGALSFRPWRTLCEETKNEEGLFIGVHRHNVHHFGLLEKFPGSRLAERTGSCAGIDWASQNIFYCRPGNCASCTVAQTGKSASLELVLLACA
jgi:hypothetical protein